MNWVLALSAGANAVTVILAVRPGIRSIWRAIHAFEAIEKRFKADEELLAEHDTRISALERRAA